MKSRYIVLVAVFLMPVLAWSSLRPSRITNVEVYLDRAMVTRTAQITLKRGETQIDFCGLPASLDNRSVQVWGTGSARATLEGVSIEMEPLPEAPAGKLGEIKRRIEQLEDRKKLIKEKKKAIEATVGMMSSVKPEKPQPAGVTSWGNIAEMEKIAIVLIQSLREAFAQGRELDSELRSINKELNALRKEYRRISQPAGGRTKCLTVTVSVSRPGAIKLEFSYLLPGASWIPLYDIRAVPDAKKVEITSYAEIIQRTGEDWSDVSLSVSTAKPSIGGTPPAPKAIYLVFYHPPRPKLRARKSAAAPPARRTMDGEMAAEEQPEAEAEAVAEVETAEIRSAGTAVFFEVKGKKSIPSDGEPHRIPIAVDNLDADFLHASWPEARPYVYLRAKVKNRAGHPFMTGKAKVFLDSSFIGNTTLDNWAATEEKTISLGVDQGVRIKRKLVNKIEKESASRRIISYEYRIKVDNFKQKPVTVMVFDRVPISRQGDIVVKVVKTEPRPTKREDNGILMWKTNMTKGGSVEIYFSYAVRFPKNRRITGLP